MTYQPISSANFSSREEREEHRFLRNMKNVLRAEVVRLQETEGLSQLQIAERLKCDPAQLSRILSPDRHNSTNSIFRTLFRLGRRWVFDSVPLPMDTGNLQPQIFPTKLTPQMNMSGMTGAGARSIEIAPVTFESSSKVSRPLVISE